MKGLLTSGREEGQVMMRFVSALYYHACPVWFTIDTV